MRKLLQLGVCNKLKTVVAYDAINDVFYKLPLTERIRHCLFTDPNVCNYDVLMIADGSKTFRHCGRGILPDYTSTGNKISITFQSDSSFELQGFNISFSTFSVETTRK